MGRLASIAANGQLDRETVAPPPQASVFDYEIEDQNMLLGYICRESSFEIEARPMILAGQEGRYSFVAALAWFDLNRVGFRFTLICWQHSFRPAFYTDLITFDMDWLIATIRQTYRVGYAVDFLKVFAGCRSFEKGAALYLSEHDGRQSATYTGWHDEADHPSPIHVSPIGSRTPDGETAGRVPQGLGRSVFSHVATGVP